MYLLTEIYQGGTTLKRKYEGDHGNENGVDSPINLNDSDINGHQDNDENMPPPLPSEEVS